MAIVANSLFRGVLFGAMSGVAAASGFSGPSSQHMEESLATTCSVAIWLRLDVLNLAVPVLCPEWLYYIDSSDVLHGGEKRPLEGFEVSYGRRPAVADRVFFGAVHAVGFLSARYVAKSAVTLLASPLQLMPARYRPWILGSACIATVLYFVQLTHRKTLFSRATLVPNSATVSAKIGRRIENDLRKARLKVKDETTNLVIRTCPGDQEAGAGTNAEYVYQPLVSLSQPAARHFRLLKLSGRGSGQTCTLDVFHVNSAPEYWAASYVWGRPEFNHQLRINQNMAGGKANYAWLPITASGAHAIKTLFPPEGTRYIWLDAVCINQDDALEKAVQVPLMGDIYTTASLVVGIVDPELTSPPVPIRQYMQDIACNRDYTLYTRDFLDSSNIVATHILMNEYWARAWIMQEIILGRDFALIYGSEFLRWHLIVSFCRAAELFVPWPGEDEWKHLPSLRGRRKLEIGPQIVMEKARRAFQPVVGNIERMRVIRNTTRNAPSLPEVATMVQVGDRPLKSTLARDRIYALLSLSSDSSIPALKPTYIGPKTDDEILRDVCIHYLRNGPTLHAFLAAGLWRKDIHYPGLPASRTRFDDEQAPSWVWDFSAKGDVNRNLWVADKELEAGHLLASCRVSKETSTLGVLGVRIGVVLEIRMLDGVSGLATDGDPDFQEHNQKYATFLDDISKMANLTPAEYPVGSQSREDAFWQTMVLDHLEDENIAPGRAAALFREIQFIFKSWAAGHISSASVEAHSDYLPTVGAEHPSAKRVKGHEKGEFTEELGHLMMRSISTWTKNVFVVVEGGYIGWAPVGTEVGDVVSVFNGCRLPFVLRPAAPEGEFRLCGFAYVQGFAEGLPEPFRSGRQEEWLGII